MSRVVFESERPPVQVDPARTDVACFVGLIRFIPGAVLPPPVGNWLKLQGWVTGPYARLSVPAPPVPTADILVPLPVADVPIPIENYSAFTALFDTGDSAASFGTDYVAAAVRTFFAQGGKRCYVVRMDDPVTPGDTQQTNSDKLQKLLPTSTYARDDQRGWHGAGHLAGLPDVSFLAMPDLPILTASAPVKAVGQVPIVPSEPAQFVECVNPEDPPIAQLIQHGFAAPRLRPEDYKSWAQAVQTVLGFLSSRLREMLFVAAFP